MTLVENILLIDFDSKIPNLAIMKISAYHKLKGDKVGFKTRNPDIVYISCIFSKNLPRAKGIPTMFPKAEVHIGGPAFRSPNYLPDDIEHIMPDYSLYEMDYSMGFTTRGCIRNCSFCIVPKIEGKFREHAPISEFHNRDFDKLILLDNNFLASTY